MKTLELKEMENIVAGGWGCALSVIGLGLAFAGMFALGPITGGASWVVLLFQEHLQDIHVKNKYQ